MKTQEFPAFYNTLETKLNREDGLCTSLRNTDIENFLIMTFIGNAYISGVQLEKCSRVSDTWHSVNSLPMDFNLRYRKQDRGQH